VPYWFDLGADDPWQYAARKQEKRRKCSSPDSAVAYYLQEDLAQHPQIPRQLCTHNKLLQLFRAKENPAREWDSRIGRFSF